MDSMEEIYHKYVKKVYWFLLLKGCNNHIAEELTQETFYQAVKGVGNFKGDSSVFTWLCSIANHVWCSYIRKKPEYMELRKEESVFVPSVEEVVIKDWDSVENLKLLHQLEEPMREVMYLRLTSNISFKEIGEIMGRTENWARVNFYRGKEKIGKEVRKKYEK